MAKGLRFQLWQTLKLMIGVNKFRQFSAAEVKRVLVQTEGTVYTHYLQEMLYKIVPLFPFIMFTTTATVKSIV